MGRGIVLNMSRKERLKKWKKKCDLVTVFLKTGCYAEGMDRDQRRSFKRQSELFQLGNDDSLNEILYFTGYGGSRKEVVTSEKLVMEIMQHYHSESGPTHKGVNNMLGKLSAVYWWPGMKEDVMEYNKSCMECQKSSTRTVEAPQHVTIITEPLQLVEMDIIGPLSITASGHRYICIFADSFTKFPDFFPLKNFTAEDVARCIQTFCYRWGAPKRLLSNQGQEFVTQAKAAISKEFGIVCSLTCASHPQTNGLEECRSTIQTLKTRLLKLADEKQNDWDMSLEEVAYTIRKQEDSTTKESPFFLMFDRNPNPMSEVCVIPSSNEILPSTTNELVDCKILPSTTDKQYVNDLVDCEGQT